MQYAHHKLDNPFFNRQRIIDPVFFHGRKRQVEALYRAIITRQDAQSHLYRFKVDLARFWVARTRPVI
jgi:hypothetical protein